MHHYWFHVIGTLLHKIFVVAGLIILLGDAGNPKSLRGKKGKVCKVTLMNTFLNVNIRDPPKIELSIQPY